VGIGHDQLLYAKRLPSSVLYSTRRLASEQRKLLVDARLPHFPFP
jgi:hypothetical protein